MGRKFLNIFEFFKSTLLINLSLSTISLVFGGINTFIAVLLSLGFILSIAVKETNRRNEYLFYYNNGISKLYLWLFSYLLTIVLLVFIIIFRNLILIYFG